MAIKHSPGCGCCGGCYDRRWTLGETATELAALWTTGFNQEEDGSYVSKQPLPDNDCLIYFRFLAATPEEDWETFFLELFVRDGVGDETTLFEVSIDSVEASAVTFPAGSTEAPTLIPTIPVQGTSLDVTVFWPHANSPSIFASDRKYTRSQGTAGTILHEYEGTAIGPNYAFAFNRFYRHPDFEFLVRQRSVEFAGGFHVDKSTPTIIHNRTTADVDIAGNENIYVRFRDGGRFQDIGIKQVYDVEDDRNLECGTYNTIQLHSPSYSQLDMRFTVVDLDGLLLGSPSARVSGQNPGDCYSAWPLTIEYQNGNTTTGRWLGQCGFLRAYTPTWQGFESIPGDANVGRIFEGNRRYWWDGLVWEYEGQTAIPLLDDALTQVEIDQIASEITDGEYWYQLNSTIYKIDDAGTVTQELAADFTPFLERVIVYASIRLANSVSYRKIVDGFVAQDQIVFTFTSADLLSLSPSDTLNYPIGSVPSNIPLSAVTLTTQLN